MDKKTISLIKEKVSILFQEEKVTHVVLRDSKKFYNGKIVCLKDTYFLIKDRLAKKVPILYKEVYKIEAYQNR